MTSKRFCTVYLARHGEDMGNVTRMNLPPDQGVLTDNGKMQAKLLGECLKDEKFDRVFTSGYARALETTQIILRESKVNSEDQFEKKVELQELNLGIHEGASVAILIKDFVDSGKEFYDWVPSGAETRQQLLSRVNKFFQENIFKVVDDPQSSNQEPSQFLVITHGAVLLHLLKFWRDDPNYNFNGIEAAHVVFLRNCAYFKFQIEQLEEGSKVRQINLLVAHGRKHLESLDVDTLHKLTTEENAYKKFKGCIQQ